MEVINHKVHSTLALEQNVSHKNKSTQAVLSCMNFGFPCEIVDVIILNTVRYKNS